MLQDLVALLPLLRHHLASGLYLRSNTNIFCYLLGYMNKNFYFSNYWINLIHQHYQSHVYCLCFTKLYPDLLNDFIITIFVKYLKNVTQTNFTFIVEQATFYFKRCFYCNLFHCIIPKCYTTYTNKFLFYYSSIRFGGFKISST